MRPLISAKLAGLADMIGARRGAALRIGGVLLAAGVTTSILSLALFSASEQSADGWLLYGISIVCVLASCYVLFPVKASLPQSTRSTVLFGLAVIGIGVILRFYRLAEIPFGTWVDEADIGLSAIQILNDPDYRPVFTDASNPPAHIFYLIALFFRLFGANTLSFRLLMACFGVGATVLAFFVGCEAHGIRFGLIFTFLFAVARWAVTFSRIGLPGMTTPFFILLTALFLLRAMRTGTIHNFLWAGVATGLGLSFYTAYRPFLLVVAVFLAYRAITSWQPMTPVNRRAVLAVNIAAFALAAGAVVAPVAQFAVSKPDVFWSRINEVSIFNRRDEPDLGKAILNNTIRHLGMFNYRGDPNGRHNQAGQPMLDPVTGALFVLGIGFALSRPRDLAHALFLIAFPLCLSSGALTLDFEAPQSLRAIGTMPIALYFAALAAETFWRGLDRIRLGVTLRRGINTIVMLGVGGFILYSNARAYFVLQANDLSSWDAHNTVETLTARHMLALGPDETTFYASMYFNNHTVIRFLAPQVHDSRMILPPDVLPIREPGDKPVAMFIDRENSWIVGEARRYYPNAEFLTDTAPDGTPVLYTIVIPPEDIRQTQGLTARYWRSDSTGGDPAFTRTEKTLEARWPDTAPLAAPFVARWDGILYAPQFGNYEISLQSPGPATLWIDEQETLRGEGSQQTTLELAEGNHTLRALASSGDGDVRLSWRFISTDPDLTTVSERFLYLSPPANNHGLVGTLYRGDQWQPPPAIEHIYPFLDLYFHIIPLERPYSVDWRGQIEAPTDGEYAFGLRVNGSAQIFIDDQLVVDAPEPTEYTEGKLSLSAGRHKIQIKFVDHLGGSRLHLYWTPPGDEKQIVPSDVLLPYP